MALRQLAAILFADIAGYTAMMQEDEVLALQLRAKLLQQLEEAVPAYQGRLMDFRGDGALCSFTSAIEAVRAALAIQAAMQENPQVPLRIGIHTGDVVWDGNSLYGDGVNLASRMESFAVPGSIFISGKVYDDIKNQKDIQTVSLGRYRLKNVKEPVEIFAVSNPGLVVPDTAGLEGKGEKLSEPGTLQQAILVLPFVNMSNDADQEYFSDGLTEEIITRLSRLNNVRVTSRTTSMQYKNTRKDSRTISREARVAYILEGSVRKAGEALRITAQFIDAERDVHLWAETYRGTMEDVFDIQEQVAEKIVEALRLHLTREEQVLLAKRYTDSTAAYQHYLKGRSFWRKRNGESLQTAIVHFEKALEEDPAYALAWSGLADTYTLMGEYTNFSRRILFPKQMAAINKALQLDHRLPEAHISLGISLMLNAWDWEGARREFRLGIELNPNYATAHHWYGEWLLFTGHITDAFREINLAIELEPASPGIVKDKGIFHYYTGAFEQALEMGMTALELDSGFVPAYRLLSLAYAGMGQFDAAIEQNKRWGTQTGNEVKTTIALAEIYALAGRRAEARTLLAEVAAGNDFSANDYRSMALASMALGETEAVFTWLDRSRENHEESLCSIGIDQKWDPVRHDPRFGALLQKIGLHQHFPEKKA